MIAEYDNGAAPANPSREYVYAGGALLAKFDSSGTEYYQQDQSSVRMMTDSSGSVIGERGDFPFGEQWYASNTTTKWAFTSYERDAESGNDYAIGREYVNRLGRFSALDAAAPSISDPQSMSRYSYVENDPINNIDPSGEDPMTQIIIAGRLNFWEFGGLGYDEFRYFGIPVDAAVGSFSLIEWYDGPHPVQVGWGLDLVGGGRNPGGTPPPSQAPQVPQTPTQPPPQPQSPGWCTAMENGGTTVVVFAGGVFVWGTIADATGIGAPAGLFSQGSAVIGGTLGAMVDGLGKLGKATGVCH